MNAQRAFPKPVYPGKVAIRRAIQAALDNGLDVGGFEIAPDGTIRILEARAVPKPAENLFDELDREGKI